MDNTGITPDEERTGFDYCADTQALIGSVSVKNARDICEPPADINDNSLRTHEELIKL